MGFHISIEIFDRPTDPVFISLNEQIMYFPAVIAYFSWQIQIARRGSKGINIVVKIFSGAVNLPGMIR